MIGAGACALGAVGGITGMLAGALAPGILTGLYALDEPEPPATFSSVIWGSQQGFLIGLLFGAGGAMLAWSCVSFTSWRPRMTTRRWMIAVVIVAVLSAIGVGLRRRSVAYSALADESFGRAAIWSDTKKIERDMAQSER
jgi:hypothetical protein